MRSSFRWIILVVALAGCREPRPETGRADALEAAAAPGDAEMGRSEPGVEFEAPRLIPAIRAQIREIEDPQGATEGNLTAFKNGVGTLIDAMKADLNRVGITDSGAFRALSDSIGRQIGRGVPAQVDRLIGMYEERMRRAAH